MNKLPSSSALSLTEKVGQLFMPAAFINDTEEEISKLESLIHTHGIGSLCFFHSRASAATNFEGKKEIIKNDQSYERLQYLIARYQKAAKYPLIIAIDAEWGLAMRIENTRQYPYAITLGSMQNQEELIFEMGKQIGYDCRMAGIHWNLAPVVDINLNANNPVIGYRSFGENKHQVTQYARAYLQGMGSVGVLNAIKHFPGHGDTDVDSHLDLPLIQKSKEDLFQNELYPFVQLMTDADAIMVGHLAVPELAHGTLISSSLSYDILTNFLRKELRWEGLIISDALNMHAVSKNYKVKGAIELNAFKAGNDVMCFSENPVEGIRMICNQISTARIEQSFDRFWNLKRKVLEQTKVIPKTYSYDSLLNNIAIASLSFLKGTRMDLKTFNEQGYYSVQIGKPNDLFFNGLNPKDNRNDNWLISLIPRQVKPKDNFGFSTAEIEEIKNILPTKKVVIYLFGNPFALNLIPWHKALAVVIAYQDLPHFQINALDHFFGKLEAQGKLPITLKKPSDA